MYGTKGGHSRVLLHPHWFFYVPIGDGNNIFKWSSEPRDGLTNSRCHKKHSTFVLSYAPINSKHQHTPPPPPPGMPRAFKHFLCPGSREFDLKVHSGSGEFDFAWVGWGIWTGSVKFNTFFLAGAYWTHVVILEHTAIWREIYRFCE